MKALSFTTVFALLTLGACGGDKETDTSTATSTTTTGTVQTGDGPEVTDVSALVSEAVGTVVRVSWKTDVTFRLYTFAQAWGWGVVGGGVLFVYCKRLMLAK